MFVLSLGYLWLFEYGCVVRVCIGVILGGRVNLVFGVRWVVCSSVRWLDGWEFGYCMEYLGVIFLF